MPGTTTNYALPYPTLPDPPNVPNDIQALATAVDTLIKGGLTAPIGDAATNSVFLSSPIAFSANDNKNILTTSVVLTRNQWVILSGHALFANQTSSASGKIGIYIDVDAVVVPQLTSGFIWMGAAGNITEFMTLALPSFSVLLAAGTHTIRLRGDRDGTTATHNAVGTQTQNQTHQPCSLTVIV